MRAVVIIALVAMITNHAQNTVDMAENLRQRVDK
jgi:hypothetical protein